MEKHSNPDTTKAKYSVVRITSVRFYSQLNFTEIRLVWWTYLAFAQSSQPSILIQIINGSRAFRTPSVVLLEFQIGNYGYVEPERIGWPRRSIKRYRTLAYGVNHSVKFINYNVNYAGLLKDGGGIFLQNLYSLINISYKVSRKILVTWDW